VICGLNDLCTVVRLHDLLQEPGYTLGGSRELDNKISTTPDAPKLRAAASAPEQGNNIAIVKPGILMATRLEPKTVRRSRRPITNSKQQQRQQQSLP
jgi:hypothetical protein